MAKIAAFTSMLKKHARVGVDSSVFIYSFEQHPEYEPLTARVFEMLSSGKIHCITSVISVSELMVRPFQKKDIDVIQLYERALTTMPNFTLADIDYGTAKVGALLRAENNILLPDALQIAGAMKHKATLFLTNDIRLKKVRDLRIACLRDYVY